MNNPLIYVDPSGYLPYNFIIWLNRWLYKNRTVSHSGTWRLGRTAKNRETTGPDGGEFFSYSPFDPWAGSNSSSTNSLGSGLGGRSGGGGSNGGGDSNPSSSSNSGNGDNDSDDATWIQPPRQQSINLSNPNYAAANSGGDRNPLYLNKVDDVIAALGITAGNINKYQIIPLKDLYSVLSPQQIANIENLSSGLKTVGTYAAVLNGAIIAFSFTQIEDKYLGDWAKFVTGEIFTLASVIIPPVGIPASLGHGFGMYDQVFDFINLWDMSRKGELFKSIDAKSIPGIPRY
jgi:hypothetical protein